MICEKAHNIIGLSQYRQSAAAAEMGIPASLSTPGDGLDDVNLLQLTTSVIPDSHAVCRYLMNN
jgi:hypothetical protein